MSICWPWVVLAAIIYLAVSGYWLGAIAAYVFGAILVIARDSRLPLLQRPLYTHRFTTASVIAFFDWPIRLLHASLERLAELFDEERFVVWTSELSHALDDPKKKKFSNFAHAIEYAKSRARQEQTRILLRDDANLVRVMPGTGSPREPKTWVIKPDGTVNKLYPII